MASSSFRASRRPMLRLLMLLATMASSFRVLPNAAPAFSRTPSTLQQPASSLCMSSSSSPSSSSSSSSSRTASSTSTSTSTRSSLSSRPSTRREHAFSVPLPFLLLGSAALLQPSPSLASPATSSLLSLEDDPSSLPSSPSPSTLPSLAPITDKVYFDMSIAGQPVGTFTMGLFGKNSPEIVGNFLKVLNGEGQSASYVYSTVWRVLDGYCIDMGRVVGGGGKKLKKEINESGVMRIKTGNAADWTRNTEVNELKHVEPYLLTMKRGGGTYEFSVTTQANKELDKDHVVFGRLLMKEGVGEEKYRKGNEEVIEKILKVKVSTDDPIASKKIFAAAGKGFDPRAKIIFLNKPLQKIVVKAAGTL